MSFVFPAALSRKEGKHDHPRYDEKLKVDRWGCFVEHEQCWQKTICVFWSQFQIWKLHLSLVSCNFITALVFFGTMFSTTFPWAPFSQKKHQKGPVFPYQKAALGCGRCANWKGQLNASGFGDIGHHHHPATRIKDGVHLAWKRRDIYLCISMDRSRFFFQRVCPKYHPKTKTKKIAPI